MTECKDCAALRAENARLRETLERLRHMVHDMGGPQVKLEDDPYEDERAPEWVWEKEDGK